MVNYDPIFDPCRICGSEPPHELRVIGQGIEVICIDCRALLENLSDAALLESVLEAAEAVQ